jgi:hypothetical protein
MSSISRERAVGSKRTNVILTNLLAVALLGAMALAAGVARELAVQP